MKRITTGLLLFLTVLCCTLTVSAAGYAINSASMDNNAVTVNVTAESDCTLFVALYDKDGRLLSVQARDIGATAGRVVAISIPGGIPAGSSSKTFLTGADNKPLCEAVNASDGNEPATDNNVYAILYTDGTMVFQHGDTPETGREVRETYAVDMEKKYNNESEIPWYEMHTFISWVEFADIVKPASTAFWFKECRKLKGIGNIDNLNTANVTDMSCMFSNCTALATLNLSSFDTANVTNMYNMFISCTALTTLDLSSFNTSNVTNMNNMFNSCTALTTLNLSSFDTAKVTDMSYMFSDCTALTTLNLSSFNTVSVTRMYGMFHHCTALTALDLSPFNTVNVTEMSYMFDGCTALTSLDLSTWNTASATRMDGMFRECTALTMLDLTALDTASVTNMDYMFYRCSGLTTLDLASFNTANVTHMYNMFSGCFNLITIYASEQFVTDGITSNTVIFDDCYFILGGSGTTYKSSYNAYTATYARIDGGTSNPGYFTAKP